MAQGLNINSVVCRGKVGNTINLLIGVVVGAVLINAIPTVDRVIENVYGEIARIVVGIYKVFTK